MALETDTLTAVAQSVTGADTPAAASVTSKPPIAPLWALVLAGPALSAGVAAILWVLAWKLWPDVIALRALELADRIIWGLVAVAVILSSLLGLVVFRLASGQLRSIKASAGPGSIEVET